MLATTKTSTMEKELNQAAREGYRLMPSTMISKEGMLSVEIVCVLERAPTDDRYEYKLLATSLTSTMQKEITPGECRQDYRSERRGNPEAARSTRAARKRVAQGNVMPKLVAGPRNRGECRRNYSSTRRDLAGANPTRRPGFGTDRTVSSPLSPRS